MTDRRLEALRDAHHRIGLLINAYREVTHWIDYNDTSHPSSVAYDAVTGSSGGEVRDLGNYVVRPNPGKVDRRDLNDAINRIIGGSIDADSIRRRNLTTKSLAPLATDDPDCAHCGAEPRYRGDLGRRCYDWKRSHAGELPPAFVLEAWRRGKQPKVRVG
jgi:hypothetical protein